MSSLRALRRARPTPWASATMPSAPTAPTWSTAQSPPSARRGLTPTTSPTMPPWPPRWAATRCSPGRPVGPGPTTPPSTSPATARRWPPFAAYCRPLIVRDRTGVGQKVETSLMQGITPFEHQQLADLADDDQVPGQVPGRPAIRPQPAARRRLPAHSAPRTASGFRWLP